MKSVPERLLTGEIPLARGAGALPFRGVLEGSNTSC